MSLYIYTCIFTHHENTFCPYMYLHVCLYTLHMNASSHIHMNATCLICLWIDHVPYPYECIMSHMGFVHATRMIHVTHMNTLDFGRDDRIKHRRRKSGRAPQESWESAQIRPIYYWSPLSCCSVLQWVAVSCRAVCCSVLQRDAVYWESITGLLYHFICESSRTHEWVVTVAHVNAIDTSQ